MKSTLILVACIVATAFLACTKANNSISTTPASPSALLNHHNFSNARYTGTNYSQSIPVDSANSMIGSYLNSIGYPSADTALRSLIFDADTLRAYLQDPSIATLKFMIAHRDGYKNSGYLGRYAGMNPEAVTMVIVGLNEQDQYVLNNRSEVYEHTAPCPNNCPGTSTALIQ
jgi:hypothetical protein